MPRCEMRRCVSFKTDSIDRDKADGTQQSRSTITWLEKSRTSLERQKRQERSIERSAILRAHRNEECKFACKLTMIGACRVCHLMPRSSIIQHVYDRCERQWGETWDRCLSLSLSLSLSQPLCRCTLHGSPYVNTHMERRVAWKCAADAGPCTRAYVFFTFPHTNTDTFAQRDVSPEKKSSSKDYPSDIRGTIDIGGGGVRFLGSCRLARAIARAKENGRIDERIFNLADADWARDRQVGEPSPLHRSLDRPLVAAAHRSPPLTAAHRRSPLTVFSILVSFASLASAPSFLLSPPSPAPPSLPRPSLLVLLLRSFRRAYARLRAAEPALPPDKLDNRAYDGVSEHDREAIERHSRMDVFGSFSGSCTKSVSRLAISPWDWEEMNREPDG